MEYKAYQHIEKIGSGEVEGILNGTCYLFYKIDGTNSTIWLKENNELGFGSRKRELSASKDGDNQGFMTTLTRDEKYADTLRDIKAYLTLHPNHTIYGEWLVPVNIKNYKEDAWRNFYVFDIYDNDTEKYINYDVYSKLFNEKYPNIKYIPLLAKLENPTEEDIKNLLSRTGEFLISEGLGEGIVIKNYEYTNKYGRRTWAKMLTEDFLSKKKGLRGAKREAAENGTSIEYEIIKLLTVDHIIKEKAKVMERRNSETFEMNMIAELLNRVFDEFWRDNWEIILKRFHNPTINFRILKTLCSNKVKEILGV